MKLRDLIENREDNRRLSLIGLTQEQVNVKQDKYDQEVKKLEIYLKLKKTIENFLEVRKNSIQEMKLKESNGLNIQYYLYLVNCLIYEQLEKIPKNFKDELKEEILNWTRYRASYGKYDPLEDYNLLSVPYCWDDKEKISTEIVENDIYPF